MLGDLIYCLGHKESYDLGLSQGPLKKRGRDGDRFGGGWVWKDREAAQRVADDWPGYAVYGLRGVRWGIDTEPAKDGDHHILLVDAEIVQLEGMEGGSGEW